MKQTLEQLKEHYNLEVRLANKLKNSTFEERKTLYKEVYNELFTKLPHHPQNTTRNSPEIQQAYVNFQFAFVKRFLKKNIVFAEIGPGDCSLAFKVANYVDYVYAVDVSDEITNTKTQPKNFKLILSDGVSVPIGQKVDVIYSDQLIEHLHEDDVKLQLKNIYNALNDAGKYVCVTPSRLSGPHDVSQYFSDKAEGFHLKEYTFTELDMLFKSARFSKVFGYYGAKGVFVKMPISICIAVEQMISWLPKTWRKNRVFISLLNIRIVGVR
ncbi:methyltransferase domain-containing protein [Winogradskyella litorisediminis]|uniref:Methyltransferase domain-containing protein n=1 Tax=Winogradskyella litorisediminis TaxID=1156618 RepID=A0ABW3NAI1_9FLAO